MTKAVEPYTDEDWAAFKVQVDEGVGVMLTNGEARSILATIEEDREKLAEKEARVSELEKELGELIHAVTTQDLPGGESVYVRASRARTILKRVPTPPEEEAK